MQHTDKKICLRCKYGDTCIQTCKEDTFVLACEMFEIDPAKEDVSDDITVDL